MSWEEIVKTPDAAGTAGAILGFLSAPGKTRREQLFNLIAGLACALYIAPFLAERVDMQSQAARMAFAFVIGLCGMNILPKITSAAKQIDWLSRFTTKKGGES